MTIPTVRYKNDGPMRKRLLVPEAMSHPAKGHLGLWQDIIQKYTLPGQTVLDPMAGVGSSLIAALMGRNVICVELEEHFYRPMLASAMKMGLAPEREFLIAPETYYHVVPELVSGWEVWVDGALAKRAQNEDELLRVQDELDAENPLPGFEPQIEIRDATWEEPRKVTVSKAVWATLPEAERGKEPAHWYTPRGAGGAMLGHTMGKVLILRGDARALPLGSVDAAVFSPPWEDTEATKAGKFADPVKAAEIQAENYRTGKSKGHPASAEAILRAMGKIQGYTRPQAIVTSPPYSALTSAEQHEQRAARTGGFRQGQETKYGDSRVQFLSQDPSGLNNQARSSLAATTNNIGNLRSDAYWAAMQAVYAECYRVLAPGGIMALVLKGFTRDGKYIDLPSQTAALVESLGFIQFDEWRRELWSLSFWRILQKRRDPAAFDDRLNYETVLAFRKPEGEGDGVQAVITSPPYESTDITMPLEGTTQGKATHRDGLQRRYTRPSAIITSPPYEGSLQGGVLSLTPPIPKATLSTWQNGNGAQAVGVGVGHAKGWHLAAEAMGIDWMTRQELTQAIPPVYTEFIGKALMSWLERKP